MADNQWSVEQEELIASDELIKPRKQREDTVMDITPMIDITFLLLIFFLVAAKMDQAADVSLPPADYGVPVPAKNSVIFTVADPGGADQLAAVYRGQGMDPDRRIDFSDLEALEEQIENYIVDSMLEHPQKQYVLIKAARQVKHRDVARVARAASRVPEVQQLHVAVLEVQ